MKLVIFALLSHICYESTNAVVNSSDRYAVMVQQNIFFIEGQQTAAPSPQ